MTPKELIEALLDLLKGLEWTASNKIFGNNVFVVPSFPIKHIQQFVLPCAFIAEAGSVSHFQHEGIVEQRCFIYFVVKQFLDNRGAYVVQGGNRIANTSSGAGILDIDTQILQNFRDAITLSGLKVVIRSNVRHAPLIIGRNNPISVRRIMLDARTYLY
jgi:hypothetical protein